MLTKKNIKKILDYLTTLISKIERRIKTYFRFTRNVN